MQRIYFIPDVSQSKNKNLFSYREHVYVTLKTYPLPKTGSMNICILLAIDHETSVGTCYYEVMNLNYIRGFLWKTECFDLVAIFVPQLSDRRIEVDFYEIVK